MPVHAQVFVHVNSTNKQPDFIAISELILEKTGDDFFAKERGLSDQKKTQKTA